jgi:hypothetical protein
MYPLWVINRRIEMQIPGHILIDGKIINKYKKDFDFKNSLFYFLIVFILLGLCCITFLLVYALPYLKLRDEEDRTRKIIDIHAESYGTSLLISGLRNTGYTKYDLSEYADGTSLVKVSYNENLQDLLRCISNVPGVLSVKIQDQTVYIVAARGAKNG